MAPVRPNYEMAPLFSWKRSTRRLASVLTVFVLVSCPTLDAVGEDTSTQMIQLGRQLFGDTRLSSDGKVSCQTCHRPELAFADGRRTAIGASGRVGTRNTPSLLNLSGHSIFAWDGASTRLEDQVLAPFFSPVEHGLRGQADLVKRVEAITEYRPGFSRLGSEVSAESIADALAAFVRTLGAPPSRFDRFWSQGDPQALSAEEKAGYQIFTGRAGCGTCHTIKGQRPSFTDNAFHAVWSAQPDAAKGIAKAIRGAAAATPEARRAFVHSDAAISELGRFNVTLEPRDLMLFRTPSLRNVAETAPYMHDGGAETLEAAVDAELYRRSQAAKRPLLLTRTEKNQLLAFLKSLSALPAPKPNE